MTSATKSDIARNVEEASQDLDNARIFVKKASARSDELLKIDMDLFARSRGQIANAGDRFKKNTPPHSSRHLHHPIDRKMLEQHLQQAERHVAVGQEHLSRQRERIAQLEQHGHDASDARKLLAQFEELESIHIAHRDRLAQQLWEGALMRCEARAGWAIKRYYASKAQ